MSPLCPQCIVPVRDGKCPECGRSWELRINWTCPECGTGYYVGGGGPILHCPKCKAIEADVAKQRMDELQVGMRSVTDDIVAQTLARIRAEGRA